MLKYISLITLFLLSSCGTVSKVTSLFDSQASTKIAVVAEDTSNGGTPFYAVVRAVDKTGFLTDNYQEIANTTFADHPDQNILNTQVIYPGRKKEILVNLPKDKAIAIYFLFTSPGDRWKAILYSPIPNRVDIALGTNQIIKQG